MTAFSKFRPNLQKAKLGDSVICFRTDGGMVHNHTFEWAGTIENFARRRILIARIKLYVYGDQISLGNHELGFMELIVDDPALQRLSNTLLIYMH